MTLSLWSLNIIVSLFVPILCALSANSVSVATVSIGSIDSSSYAKILFPLSDYLLGLWRLGFISFQRSCWWTFSIETSLQSDKWQNPDSSALKYSSVSQLKLFLWIILVTRGGREKSTGNERDFPTAFNVYIKIQALWQNIISYFLLQS